MPARQIHREVFLAHYGPGPWQCFKCWGLVYFDAKFDVHHLDHDHDNNDPTNLAASHPHCHRSYHNAHPEGWQRQQKGKKHPEHSEKMKGKTKPPRTEEHREALAESKREWHRNNPEQSVIIQERMTLAAAAANKKHGVFDHGTRGGYTKYGCRCQECVEAEQKYQRQYRERK